MSLISLFSFIFFLSLTGILSVFFFYPLFLLILSFFFPQKHLTSKLDLSNFDFPTVSLIIAVYNAEKIVERKIQNSLSLNYPREKLEIIFSSDGSTDLTVKIIEKHAGKDIKLISHKTHQGKAYALNRGVKNSSGEIILFSDADAILAPDSIQKMVRHYKNPKIGGVCGQRVIYKEDSPLKSSQRDYIKFDSMIKGLETRLGSITSNDGKIYSIRRNLFQPIDEAVTDDLYTCLGVVMQGYHFIFEPEAKAYISLPSRNPYHEIQRRRRIVARSLSGIYLRKDVLNIFKYGLFSFRLFINKILRRMVPIFLILLFISSTILATSNPLIKFFWLVQVACYLLTLLYFPTVRFLAESNPLRKLSSHAFYFCIGNLGTLLGLFSFLKGERISKWRPIKTDF